MIHSCLWLRLFPPPLGAPAAPHKDSIEEHGQYCKAQGLMYLIISPSVLRFAHVCIEFERFFRLFGWSKIRKTQTKNYAHTHTHHLLEEPKQTLNKKTTTNSTLPHSRFSFTKKNRSPPPQTNKKKHTQCHKHNKTTCPSWFYPWPFHPRSLEVTKTPLKGVKFSLTVPKKGQSPISVWPFLWWWVHVTLFQRLERWPLIDRGSFLSLCLNHHRCVFFIGKNAGTLGMCVFIGYQHFPYDFWNVSFLSFVTLYGSSLVKIRLMTSVRMK